MNLKRLTSLALCIVMLVSFLVPLTACDKECTEHIDANADGKCDNCGATVTVSCTQHIDANGDNKCDNCGTEMAPAGQTVYTINVKTLGGMPLEGINVFVYHGNDIKSIPETTDENGNVQFTLETKTGYTIRLEGVPDGYNVLSGETPEQRYPMQPTGAEIVLSSKPVTEGGLKSNYNVGDIMYDFTITDTKGNVHKLSDILKTKRMVMLNFWYVDCSWCNKEFPGLNDSYKTHDDMVEILAINDYASDSLKEVKDFPTTGLYEGEDNNLVFPFFKITDSSSLAIGKFGGFGEGNTGYPTSIIIDRYGLICMIEQGAIVGEAKWDKIFDYFTSDNYTQKLIHNAEDLTPPEKPNVEWVGSDAIANNFSSTPNLPVTYGPEVGDEWSWPFVPATVEGINLVKPSNKTDNSYGILYANIQLKPGQAVMFDYFASCEYSNDRLVVIVDGNDICSLTGVNQGSVANLSDWEECCAYVDPRPITEANKDDLVTYELAFAYIKDTETSAGDDTVYLKNLNIINVEDITAETYIIRDAVSDPTPDKSGFNTYVDYYLGEDGYYHVVNPNGGEGPLLLVSFLGYTNFDSYKTVSQRVMDEGEILVNGVDMYFDWMVYARAASNSAIYGFTPVNATLKSILDAYCNYYRNDAGKDNHEDLWLQLCTYYDVYGMLDDGTPTPNVADPIKGLTTYSAFETDFPENPEIGDKVTYSVTYDRVIMPRGYLYKFVPKTSGVYRVTSKSDAEVYGWIFTGSSREWWDTDPDTGAGKPLVDFEEEERYCPDLNIPVDNGFARDYINVSLVTYMEAGKEYYIDIAYYDVYAEGTFEFDIKYEGPSGSVFVMASPGPVTYIEGTTGELEGLIAIGIDYGFKDDGSGTKYAYQVIERDSQGNVTKWGEKIYADFYYPTIPFPSQSIVEIARIGGFNFAITALDRDALTLLDEIKLFGKGEIIKEWIADGNENASTEWASRGLDDIMSVILAGGNTDSYSIDDVAVAERAVEIGTLELKRTWGIEAIGSEEDWEEYQMEAALAGTLSSDATIRETQETVLAGIDRYWNSIYQMDDVAKGIYHGDGKDETETINKYIALMENDTANNPERQGCVAVTEELAEILHMVFESNVFEDVQHDWLKFCFYYKQLTA